MPVTWNNFMSKEFVVDSQANNVLEK